MTAFMIEDSGVGIPKEQQSRVLERFESRSQGSKHRGAGLGLSIVKSLVELHGGGMMLESEPGRGTRVTVRFPENGTHFDHVWRFADKGDGHMEEVHGLRDKYRADVAILVVDDDKGCGLATRVNADAEDAFAVVHHACAAASFTLAHEIGHLLGARHEFAYVGGTKWRDIMGLKESCGGCPRLPVWANLLSPRKLLVVANLPWPMAKRETRSPPGCR